MNQLARQPSYRFVAVRLAAVALAASFGMALPQCGNDAVGVDACRRIEETRCELVMGCPGALVQTAEEVEECKLTYRDQCLYGIADSMNPDGPAVEACLDAIGRARACWNVGLTLGACYEMTVDGGSVGPKLAPGVSSAETGCGAIMAPEKLDACGFLRPQGSPAATTPAPDASDASSPG